MFEEMKQPPDKSTNCINSKKEKAKQLFLQALNHERDENYLKATKFYQEAVKLYPNVLKIYIDDNSESSDKNTPVEETTQREQNVYMINILTENFLGIIKFLDFYSLHRFLFSCKEIHSHVSVESEYKRLCDRNFQNCEEKSKAYGNSFKRLLLEYPRIRHDGVYISCVTYIRSLKDIGNIHLDPKDRDRVIYNPCVVTYFRYLLFINESNKVLVMRSEVNKKEVLEALKISYNKIRSWDLSVPSHDLIKSLIKFQGETENGLVKMVRIGEYTFKESEKVIEISYPESLSEPLKYKNIIQLRLKNYLSANNNMLKWMSFKILSQLKLSSSEDTLNINNRQYRPFFFFNLKFLSHLFITKIPET
ncbi:DNA replication origin binding protein, putative [Plasmodium knowlesi strain H]|uniref:DNA replication origin binding protein, putative n=3 Tax=Plasmodium knowlesi TaxID=5850 RepID=A0A1A7W3T3_PLAKH|nr:F-box only protein 9 homolog, putative [Plasmodium knowlesi strain H]OTN63654.1 putative DNA replication origin binding protein [Plasmodium knowlesi]CAA9991264.1 F-box only protein 9 homolog, putative [Plasmodium knowlesi strain H]SBO26349.1 DNA replication origin binding protein, putative [Plasmodium knowlesi strain H]SBO29029.1 DNA replication origin binding protein, putative [Plasmodium knowlesi strain H]VVS80738.1 F-box only protein 9 homolog, putative [Plasmodium knowlesi strain H]